MILSNQFLVKASIDRVWGLLDDLENVIPCMPGGALHRTDGEDNKVSIKVKVGAISLDFQGTVRFLEKNETTHVAGSAASARIWAAIPRRRRRSLQDSRRYRLKAPARRRRDRPGDDRASSPIRRRRDCSHPSRPRSHSSPITFIGRSIPARPNVSDFPETVNATTPASEGNTNKAMRGGSTRSPPDRALLGPIVLRYALKYVAVPVGFVALAGYSADTCSTIVLALAAVTCY